MALGLINILVPMSKVSGRFFFGLPDAFIEATRLGAIVDRTNFVAAAYVLFTIEMGIDDAIAFFVSIQVAFIFPVIIAPAMVVLAKVFGSKKKRRENTNL